MRFLSTTDEKMPVIGEKKIRETLPALFKKSWKTKQRFKGSFNPLLLLSNSWRSQKYNTQNSSLYDESWKFTAWRWWRNTYGNMRDEVDPAHYSKLLKDYKFGGKRPLRSNHASQRKKIAYDEHPEFMEWVNMANDTTSS